METIDNSVVEKSHSESGAIFTAIPKVMEEMDAVGKNQSGDGLKYKFRGIDDLYNALQKIMAKNKVFCVPHILNRERVPVENKYGTKGNHFFYQFKYRFFAEDGSFVDSFTDGEGIDWSDKGSNKVASISQKYALLQTFMVPTADMSNDPDNVAPEAFAPRRMAPPVTNLDKSQTQVSAPQIKRLMTIVGQTEWTNEQVKETLKNKWQLTSSKNLNVKQYEELVNIIQNEVYEEKEIKNYAPQS